MVLDNLSQRTGLKAVDSSIIFLLMPWNVDDFMGTNEANFLGHHTLTAIFKIGVRGGNEKKGRAQLWPCSEERADSAFAQREENEGCN